MEGVSYEWMHPSWRDLVIEHLIQNRIERRQFISRCGLNGILLAISFGGGAEGLRKYPLLVEQEDWRLFQDRVKKYLEDSELTDDHKILSSIDDSLMKLAVSEDVELENMKELAANAIIACKGKWDSREEIIPNNLLKNYYSISEYIKPLPPGPDIEATWNHVIEIVRFDLGEYFDIGVFSNHVDEWAVLLNILFENEPRFLRQQPLQEVIDSRLEKIISEVEGFDIEDYRKITTGRDLDEYLDELDYWADELYGLWVSLKKLVDSFSVKTEKIQCLQSLIEHMGARRNKLEEEYDYRRYEDEEGDNEQEWHKIPDRSSETFNIDALFNDL